MLAYSSGLVSWVVMLLGLCLSDGVRLSRQARWARPVRRVADGTFTLYLFHYPLLCLIVPLGGQPLQTGWATLWVVLAIVASSVLAAKPISALKTWMRRRLSAQFATR